MLDTPWLGRWFSAPHLAPGAISAWRDAFAAHPARVIHLPGALTPPLADAVAGFLHDEAEFTTGHGLLTRYGFVPEHEFHAAPEAERFFRYGAVARVAGPAARTPRFRAFAELLAALADPRTRALFAALTGRELGGFTASARRMAAGDFLVPHADDVGGRELSFVIYLSPGWAPAWGGELRLDAGDGSFPHVVEPRFNSMVVFDARTWHVIAPFRPGLGANARATIGGWFTAPGAL